MSESPIENLDRLRNMVQTVIDALSNADISDRSARLFACDALVDSLVLSALNDPRTGVDMRARIAGAVGNPDVLTKTR